LENKQYLFTIYQERKKEVKITQELPILGDQSTQFAPPPK
jgi:hypothetical protein